MIASDIWSLTFIVVWNSNVCTICTVVEMHQYYCRIIEHISLNTTKLYLVCIKPEKRSQRLVTDDHSLAVPPYTTQYAMVLCDLVTCIVQHLSTAACMQYYNWTKFGNNYAKQKCAKGRRICLMCLLDLKSQYTKRLQMY